MNRLRALLPSIGLLAFAGCDPGLQLPQNYPLARYTQAQLLGEIASEPEALIAIAEGSDAYDKIIGLLAAEFGTPENPGMREEYMSQEQLAHLKRGSQLYQRNCIHCHGLNGGGNGPTADFLNPRPRDYRRGIFKWKSTKFTFKPTRQDLLRTIKNGAFGSSMPPFRLMPEEDLEDLVDYVIFLSKRGEVERFILGSYVDNEGDVPAIEDVQEEYLTLVDQLWKIAENKVVSPDKGDEDISVPLPSTPEFEVSVQRGKKLFLGEIYGCYKCHGKDGRANPDDIVAEEKKKMVDDWGYPNFPRNLTLGLYRGGRRPIDLYLRIHEGIRGAAMPEQSSNPKREAGDLWDLVNFVRTLPYREDLLESQQEETHTNSHASEE